MNLGFFTMPLHPPGTNFTELLKSDLQQIIRLDELGYEEAWIGEHFTAQWEPIPSPELFIAQAIGLTKNIRLGTGAASGGDTESAPVIAKSSTVSQNGRAPPFSSRFRVREISMQWPGRYTEPARFLCVGLMKTNLRAL